MGDHVSDNSASGGPEYLEAGAGSPLPATPGTESTGSGRRKGLLVAGGVAVLAVVGVGAWAAASFLQTGAQPAEALPASTLGYASVDLDPSGSQKLEALRTLNKFPAFEDELGLDTDDDIREWVFEQIEKDAQCGLDYDDDIEPWLGERMAVAAVPVADEPTPVVVLQVRDADRADDGLRALSDCGEGSEVGWVIEGDWAVLAEDTATAQQVVDATGEGTLADDETFQELTSAAGDPGIAAAYAAPEAGRYLAELGDQAEYVAGAALDESGLVSGTTLDPGAGASQAFDDFDGAAVTVRFSDGALEVEGAGGLGVDLSALYGTDRGADVIESLPEDTIAAVGAGFDPGWLTALVEQAVAAAGDTSVEDVFAEASAATGLDLPDDAEALLGDSAAFVLGGDFDLEALTNSSDLSQLPVALKVHGDPAAVEAVLDKLAEQQPQSSEVLGHDDDGDVIVIGPDAGYRAQLLDEGSLGSSDVYRDVVRESGSAGAVLFVNFNASEDWLVELAGDDPSVAENLEPLAGFGITAWEDGGYAHSMLRLTTD